jgi:hypothetical protein
MCDCYVSALFVVKSYFDNVPSDFLPARRDFYFSHRLLLLFALKKIAETSDSGAESNQKVIRN